MHRISGILGDLQADSSLTALDSMFVRNWARIVACQGLKDQSEDLVEDYYSIVSVSKFDLDC